MNKKQGFILKPETYNQKEWYELFMNLSKEYRKECNIINELEKWCNECIDYQIIARENGDTTISDTFFEIVLDKLKELKDDNNV